MNLLIFLALTTISVGEVRDTSYQLPSGEQVLRQEVTVRASSDEVFTAFTTDAGLRGFAAPVVSMDLRVGGLWESSYDIRKKPGDEGTIKNEVLSYLPGKMLSIRIKETPAGFPHSDIVKSVWTVMLFEDMGDGTTRVEISMLPWKRGENWDEMQSFFRQGNAVVLRNLQTLFTTGPVDWSATRPLTND
ncbi:MAG TPA: SRPBCC domain-containing protein [Thermoanaerobaculia bacterium]